MKHFEKKWQKKWLKEKLYEPNFFLPRSKAGRAKKPAKSEARHGRPFYNLMMFPYPSAEGLHVGAARTFSGVDAYGRFKRMQGYDVFEPIGLDGFGIHSENYALKIGKHPAQHAKDSEKNFYRQLSELGNGFAWEERLETYDPAYYQWTQWIFTQMFTHGLAYRKKAPVNWCPSCKTVLADEQVIGGHCERCDTIVVKKDLEQWFFKITDYAERLLHNLDALDWPESIKIAQRNWIGRSEGALIKFKVQSLPDQQAGSKSKVSEYIEVFTTRPDTIFGATFLVVNSEHPLAKTSDEQLTEERTGIELKGIKAINPANGEEIPIWVADYVLGNVGTGAIMAVPAHDERDFEFAKKFKLPVVNVIEPTYGKPQGDEIKKQAVISVVRDPKTDKIIMLNWGPRQDRYNGNMLIGGTMHDGEDLETTARREIAEETGYTDLKLIKKSGIVGHGFFYSNTKNHNVHVDAYGLYFELQSHARQPTNLDHGERNKFSVEWHTTAKIAGMLHDGIHEYFFRTLVLNECYQGQGILANSRKFNGIDSEKAKWEITKFVGGERKIQYRLRDWLVSRQRYWGPPIPMIYCPACALQHGSGQAWQPVLEKDLPIKLPYIKNFRPTGTEKAPLATVKKFWKVKCPKCGGWARRETDVSDSFLDSSWYYLGYLILGNQKSKIKNQKFNFNKNIVKKWLPVHSYIGGAEHAVLHLLYSRFVAMALHDWGAVHFSAKGGSASGGEPFTRFRAHGLITKDAAKMSKSRGNVVSPDPYIEKYGADAVRMYLAFLAPFEEGGDFRDRGIKGITRFLDRVWNFATHKQKRISKSKFLISKQIPNSKFHIQKILHKTIKKVTEDIEALHYNTAISALMILLNAFEKEKESVGRKEIEIFLKLLAPFAPFLTEELWREKLGNKKSIHIASWPLYDSGLLEEEMYQLIVQINGKMRDTVEVNKDIDQKEAERLARGRDRIKSHLEGSTVRKIIFITNRLINFVV